MGYYSFIDRVRSPILSIGSIGILVLLGIVLMPLYLVNRTLAIQIFRSGSGAGIIFLFRALGVPILISGTHITRPSLIVANHAHMLDIILMIQAVYSGLIGFVAKRSLSSFPYFTDLIFVDRDGSDIDLLRRVKEQLAVNQSICIFPEGRRVGPHESVAFSRSIAIIARYFKLPVVPVSHNVGHILNPLNTKSLLDMNRTRSKRPICMHIHRETTYEQVVFKYCFDNIQLNSTQISHRTLDIRPVIRIADATLKVVDYDLNRAIAAYEMLQDLTKQAKDEIFTNAIEAQVKDGIVTGARIKPAQVTTLIVEGSQQALD